MAIDAIMRVSFNSIVKANRGANSALAGTPTGDHGSGPFTKVATAAYSCSSGNDADVAKAIAELGTVITSYAGNLDFVSITLVKRKQPRLDWALGGGLGLANSVSNLGLPEQAR